MWLVTGGAGYIGAHVVRGLLAESISCLVLDDLSTGRRSTVPEGVPFVRADVRDLAAVSQTLRAFGVDGVIHLAGKKSAPESIAAPLYYYGENVSGMAALLTAMESVGVRRLVHSSSCSVYGAVSSGLVDEDAPLAPVSPYGETKLVCEWMIADARRAHGLSAVRLRYFNVAGAGEPGIGDTGAFNLVPLAFRALDAGVAPVVNGTDYPTPDGSCVRDYVHVVDLADAHVQAARRLEDRREKDHPVDDVFNVGRGEGTSVLEVFEAVAAATGLPVVAAPAPRRPGDPARIVGSCARIERAWGWKARHDLTAMVESAWLAWQSERATADNGPGRA